MINGELSAEFSGGEPISAKMAFFLEFLRRRKAGRYLDYFDRKASSGFNIPLQILSMSQGTSEPLHWKGHILYKTAYDMAIYQELFDEIKPKTVIELGAGDGGSAIWFSDILRSLEIDGHVYSLDLDCPAVSADNVTFIKGDCNEIEKSFNDLAIQTWPRPWVVIEDAHVNVTGVLSFFARHLQTGDYLIIEDSLNKENAIGKFILAHRNDYRVDTYYTDMFGNNATCSIDSILRKM